MKWADDQGNNWWVYGVMCILFAAIIWWGVL